MGVLNDFFRFVSAVLLGRKDSGKAFRDAVGMAERYVRWGSERRDIRDYMGALDQLDHCDDGDAPKADFLVRKYMVLCNATVGAVELMVAKHRETVKNISKSRGDLERERQAVDGQIRVGQKRIADLKSDGSLIKARDEERHMEDLRAKLAHVTSSLNSGEGRTLLTESFERLASEAEQLFSNLEAGLVSLEANPQLMGDAV